MAEDALQHGGAFASYRAAARREHYPVLCEPDGRVYFAGEHMSWLTGWMGGAPTGAGHSVTSSRTGGTREGLKHFLLSPPGEAG